MATLQNYHSRKADEYEAEAHNILKRVNDYISFSIEDTAAYGTAYVTVLVNAAQAYATLALSHRTAVTDANK